MSYTRLQNKLFYFLSFTVFLRNYFSIEISALLTVVFLLSFFIYIPKTKKMRFLWAGMILGCLLTSYYLIAKTNMSFGLRAIGIAILYLMMHIKNYIDQTDIDAIYLSDYNSKKMTTFEHLLQYAKTKEQRFTKLKEAMRVIDTSIILNIIEDSCRTSSIRYVNAFGLSDAYFEEAKKSLEDENIYIVLSDTGSNASRILSVFTERNYNHVSISFDSDLKTIVSYNGGEKIYPPGLNRECIEFFHKKKDASILVYSLKVTRKQKEKMINLIQKINEEGSSYNIVGLAVNFRIRTNIMYCSQFLDFLLTSAEADYYDKKQKKIKPTDFVELDYMRRLKLEEKIVFE